MKLNGLTNDRRFFLVDQSRLFLMKTIAFSSAVKAVIKNDFIEKEWYAYRIFKEHPTKNWDIISVQSPLNCFKKSGSMDRRPGSERPQMVTSEENEEMIENLMCLQEQNPGTHMLAREIEKYTGSSCSSVRRMVKEKD